MPCSLLRHDLSRGIDGQRIEGHPFELGGATCGSPGSRSPPFFVFARLRLTTPRTRPKKRRAGGGDCRVPNRVGLVSLGGWFC